MQCIDVSAQLKHAADAGNTALTGVLREPTVREHLGGCAACRTLAEQLCLDAQLRRIPVPPPSENFAQRALDTAWTAKVERDKARSSSFTYNKGWMLATAASVVLAAGVLFNQNIQVPGADNTVPVVQVAHQAERQIDLLMVSGKDLPNANITVRFDENINLVGYPSDVKVLSWQAPISAGENHMRLPVRHVTGSDGFIVVVVESEGASKQMQFAVSTENKGKANAITI